MNKNILRDNSSVESTIRRMTVRNVKKSMPSGIDFNKNSMFAQQNVREDLDRKIFLNIQSKSLKQYLINEEKRLMTIQNNKDNYHSINNKNTDSGHNIFKKSQFSLEREQEKNKKQVKNHKSEVLKRVNRKEFNFDRITGKQKTNINETIAKENSLLKGNYTSFIKKRIEPAVDSFEKSNSDKSEDARNPGNKGFVRRKKGLKPKKVWSTKSKNSKFFSCYINNNNQSNYFQTSNTEVNYGFCNNQNNVSFSSIVSKCYKNENNDDDSFILKATNASKKQKGLKQTKSLFNNSKSTKKLSDKSFKLRASNLNNDSSRSDFTEAAENKLNSEISLNLYKKNNLHVFSKKENNSIINQESKHNGLGIIVNKSLENYNNVNIFKNCSSDTKIMGKSQKEMENTYQNLNASLLNDKSCFSCKFNCLKTSILTDRNKNIGIEDSNNEDENINKNLKEKSILNTSNRVEKDRSLLTNNKNEELAKRRSCLREKSNKKVNQKSVFVNTESAYQTLKDKKIKRKKYKSKSTYIRGKLKDENTPKPQKAKFYSSASRKKLQFSAHSSSKLSLQIAQKNRRRNKLKASKKKLLFKWLIKY